MLLYSINLCFTCDFKHNHIFSIISIVPGFLQTIMKLLVPAALLLTSAVLRIAAEVVMSTGTWWQSANVRESLVSTTVVQTYTTVSEPMCASIATQAPWCSLYCYIEGVCQLLNYTFPATTGLKTNCKTTEPMPGEF